ncbi:preprotein translocase subunit SecA [Rickettsia typhi]|uniref:Protein translocase subunit SecA n=2 Tax=Rickettsia typhi TaxID=785 RepID=SECA_RICTY|nr:preprotein translocase subunit SecA [Rickettsia typhi]Q6TUJ8.1 RecName: Full=Protein translocase subunit SecA [Rickettsia typhi str. Wilmington]AAQ96293.1 preprotein translocase SecA subunit [Rickettsia typhi str. Wilmington]AAU04031.1 preprotein translocase SecA subunit [Rickettsia typhi str. Wilmington]AFE54409.1 preprotein translocase subunit SecA [Rickettsia typhi str. TH1527]AFE55247.1 preprotein translocase subunit SecA [Rickettsia typhi str. B9991CWPP]
MFSILKKLFGTANDRTVKKLFSEITKINSLEPAIKILSDAALKNKTVEFKEKLKNGATLDDILYEAFAVVREAASRVCGMRHFDVQLIGGLILHRGMIAEMRTGEGKTLVATLPAYLNALTGKGVHVVTVNDYLAIRDSASMGKIYNFLGLSVGCIVAGMTDEAKRIAYNSDITHATNNELGFDYLRDNMKYSMQERVLRPFNFAIIDEVDSILIDEARTPIVISGPVNDNSALYGKIDKIIRLLNDSDFEKDEKLKTINLTEVGITNIESLLIKDGIIKPDTGLYDFENLNLVHYVNQALRAHHMFTVDVDYLVREGKVMIIDEFTGRVMEGRRYSEGLHQALEAKENVKIQNENQTLASITFQNYFRNYHKLSGMTGTSMTEASELKDIYNLDVVAVPTHNKVTRIDLDDEIYGSKQEKYDAILKLIRDCYNRGQPILVGTISIEKSEELSSILNKEKIPHNVLNAKFHEQEAFIIAQAGRFKAVTIATNMAGRGTDIMLGGNPEMLIEQLNKDRNYVAKTAEIKAQIAEEKQKVIETGGLFVIGTERHESRRIDNQLRGRSGRQGDPGKTQFFLSLDDDLMRIFASDRISGVLRTLGLKNGEAIHHPMISRSLEKAQQKVEAHNYEMRKNLLRFDDVMNDQRKIIYEQRTEIIKSKDSYGFLNSTTEELARKIVLTFMPLGSYREDWDIDNLTVELHRIFSIKFDHNLVHKNDVTEEDITKLVIQMAHDIYKSKEEAYSSELMNNAVKYILLTTLDQVWKDHLYSLDHLRQGISLRAYAQKDPLSEYKREAFNLFEQMLNNLKELFIQTVYHFHIDLRHLQKEDISLEHKKLQKNMCESREDPAFSKYNAGNSIETYLKPVVLRVDPKDRKPDDPMSWGRVSRNELCPCGSGKKYKYCHGAN